MAGSEEYYRKRAQEELKKAEEAVQPDVELLHLRFAAEYARRSKDPPPPIPDGD